MSLNTSFDGADAVVTFVALDVSVTDKSGTVIKPIACLVIMTKGKPRVIRMAISKEEFCVNLAARAILDATNSGTKDEYQRILRLGLDTYRRDRWETLMETIVAADLMVVGTRRNVTTGTKSRWHPPVSRIGLSAESSKDDEIETWRGATVTVSSGGAG